MRSKDSSVSDEDPEAQREQESLLLARAYRRLVEHALLERRVLLITGVVLALAAVGSALVGDPTATAVSGTAASGFIGALLRAPPGPPP